MRVEERRRRRPSPAILSQRARLHIVYRLVTRAYQAFLLRQQASPRPSGLGRAAAACAVGDVLTGLWLRRSERFALPPRLVLDAADAACWSSIREDYYDEAVLTGVPLALEAGARLGALGLVVPGANAMVTAVARRRRGMRLRLGAFKWQAIAVAGGGALASYQRRSAGMVERRWAQQLEAQRHQARLSGQNDVAMGADSVVDLLTRTTPLLTDNQPVVLTETTLADWKAALAAETTQSASYLGATLRQWERHHNRQPDLSRDVELHLSEGDGTLLLTAPQAAALHELLDHLPLRGPVKVEVPARDQPLPGAALELRLNGQTLGIPGDPRAPLAPFDPGPMILAVSPCWFAVQALTSLEDAPVLAVLPTGIVALGLAGWAHVSIERHGRAAHPRIVAAASGLSLLNSLLVTPTMRRPWTDEEL